MMSKRYFIPFLIASFLSLHQAADPKDLPKSSQQTRQPSKKRKSCLKHPSTKGVRREKQERSVHFDERVRVFEIPAEEPESRKLEKNPKSTTYFFFLTKRKFKNCFLAALFLLLMISVIGLSLCQKRKMPQRRRTKRKMPSLKKLKEIAIL